MRIIVLVERSGSNTEYFGFEFAPYLTALFKDHLRGIVKSQCWQMLWKHSNQIIKEKRES